MAHGHKFDVKNLERLRDPERLRYLPPDTLWNLLAVDPIRTIVDIGAGIGFFSIPFGSRIPEGKVYACDLSRDMIVHLEEAIQAAGVENVVAVATEEVRVPLESGIADVVMMANLHHELDHPIDSLTEVLRLLREGGMIAIVDWKNEETPSGPPLHVRIPPDKVAQQLREAGFAEIASHATFPYHYAITALKPIARSA